MADNQPPIVESFSILGLHGYKDIKVEFASNIKIIIAENGAGKTTILSALNAFLSGDFFRLAPIPFTQIRCKLRGLEEPLILDKTAPPTSQTIFQEEIVQTLRDSQHVNSEELIYFLTEVFHPEEDDSWQDHPYANAVYAQSPWVWEEVQDRFEAIKENYSLSSLDEPAREAMKVVRETLRDFQILYLPTYRRVERPRRRTKSSLRRSRRYGLALGASRKEEEPSDIQYGLQDVEERLTEISNKIQGLTNENYRKISAEIIDDMLTGNFDIGKTPKHLPPKDKLKRFLARVGSSESTDRIENFYATNEDGNDVKSSPELGYFFSKLSQVIDETALLESQIETFVEKTNEYLLSTSDRKHLLYNPAEMKVTVQNDFSAAKTYLNDLSSGEKQVVSLLAYLYLYEGKRIILMDEPELSLSMDWQKKILPDMSAAPSCAQMLAITHSPFIFDNELDRFAEPLDINRYTPVPR